MLYAIWKDVEDQNVRGVKDLVGIFNGDWKDADNLVDEMNKNDIEVAKQVEYVGHIRYGYWKQEIPAISLKNFREFIAT